MSSDTTDGPGSSVNRTTFGHHPLLVFLDRPEIAGGEALAGLLRPGNAGSNTGADHITVVGVGAGIAAAGLPVRPGRSRGARDPGALRFGRGHTWVRRRVP